MLDQNMQCVLNTATKDNLLFGEWLVQKGGIDQQQLQDVLEKQRADGGRLGHLLVQQKALKEDQLIRFLAEYLGLDSMSLEDLSVIDKEIARAVSENIAKRFAMLAVQQEGDRIVVAMSDPLNVVAIDTVSVKLKKPIKIVLASDTEIQWAIEYIYHGTDVEEQKIRDLVEFEISNDDDDYIESTSGTDISDSTEVVDVDDAPVIRFVDLMLSQAIKSGPATSISSRRTRR